LIYLDHAATTPVHREVLEKMYQLESDLFGNPSSIHAAGREAKFYLDDARSYLASTINANEQEIFFTSGGTEANNLAIIGTVMANEHKGNHIITSAQEHHAILHIMEFLQSKGFHVTYLPVNEDGQIDPNDLSRTLTNQTILVSIMTANNETGVVQPIEEIATILDDHQAHFHTDAVQAYSMMPINVKKMRIDLLTTSAHKLSGPKGIGFLYKRKEIQLQPLHYGGKQERTIRPGTENVIGAIGFHHAATIAIENQSTYVEQFSLFKQKFLQTLRDEEVEFEINGNINKAIPTIVNLYFPNIASDVLLTNLDLENIAASSGSACTAGSVEPSHVLKSMFGQTSDRIKSSLRFSFGHLNNEENVEEAARKLAYLVKRLNR